MNKHEELMAFIMGLSDEEVEKIAEWLNVLSGLTEEQRVYSISLLDELFGNSVK